MYADGIILHAPRRERLQQGTDKKYAR
jgi:hypothetical protein